MNFPGAQKKVKTFWFTSTTLGILTILVFITLLISIIQENEQIFSLQPIMIANINIWKIKILDSNTATVLLVGLLTIFFIRKQLAYGLRPYLDYRCQQIGSSVYALDQFQKEKIFWSTSLSNVGLGLAIIKKAYYRVSFEKNIIGKYNTSLEVIDSMKKKGIVIGHDFDIIFFSEGWSLGSKEERRIFEIVMSKSIDIFCLDIKLEFEGILGDRYTKEIYCIPRHGIDFHSNTSNKIVLAK